MLAAKTAAAPCAKCLPQRANKFRARSNDPGRDSLHAACRYAEAVHSTTTVHGLWPPPRRHPGMPRTGGQGDHQKPDPQLWRCRLGASCDLLRLLPEGCALGSGRRAQSGLAFAAVC